MILFYYVIKIGGNKLQDVVVETMNISKRYKDTIALLNINLKIERGKIYGLIGKNGAGKTTLLKIICGLCDSDYGEINIFGKSGSKELNKQRRRIGCTIEETCFYEYLTVKENLEYYRIQRGIVEKDHINELIEKLDLKDVKDKKFRDLSLGMKQRLGIALAFLNNPDILILDEPINSLDSIAMVLIREYLLTINKKFNTTILISSHLLGEIENIATDYIFLDKGQVIETSSYEKIKRNCKKCLSLKVNDYEKVTTIIEKEMKIKKYEVLNNEIRIYEYIDNPQKIVKELTNNNIEIYSIITKEKNMEEYFFSLIREKHYN